MRDDVAILKTLRDNLIAIEWDIALLEKEIEEYAQKIGYMQVVLENLKANLEVLKNQKVIAMASQYKQTVAEIKNIESTIKNMEYQISLRDIQLNSKNRHFETMQERYQHQKKIVENSKVVLRFDQSKRKKR